MHIQVQNLCGKIRYNADFLKSPYFYCEGGEEFYKDILIGIFLKCYKKSKFYVLEIFIVYND